MNKVLFILADPNGVGLMHKGILPTLKHTYNKKGIKIQIIDLYKDGFDPLSKNNLISNSYKKAYKHAIKTANHIHIITTTNLGGFSPAFEGFLDRIIFDEYINKEVVINSKTFFHVFHDNRKNVFRFNFAYLRLRLLICRNVFSNYDIYQYDLNLLDKLKKNKKLNQVRNKILNNI